MAFYFYYRNQSSYATNLLLKLNCTTIQCCNCFKKDFVFCCSTASYPPNESLSDITPQGSFCSRNQIQSFVLVFQASKSWQSTILSSHTSSELHFFLSPQVLNFRACPFCKLHCWFNLVCPVLSQR